MSHNSTAKLIRLNKEKYPQWYCSHPDCLYRTETALGHRECPKHSANIKPEAYRESQASQACDEGYMNDVRFGDSPDY